MRDNRIQFAVVREDPEIEAALLPVSGPASALLIASGGCTAFHLQKRFASLELTLVDSNPAQLDLIRRKLDVLATGVSAAEKRVLFNVGTDNASGLNACGNFESLFRGLRDFIHEFVLPLPDLEELLRDPAYAREAERLLFTHRYWRTAFELYFSDSLLNTMFGPEATRHAVPGSYPTYFREVFERGIRRSDARLNYFLHHALLGKYLPEAAPEYIDGYVPRPIAMIQGSVGEVADFARYDLIGLSNIFDWMASADIEKIAARLRREVRKGATILFRQLNHASDFRRLFAPEFEFDDKLSDGLLRKDRSLFYSQLSVGRRR